MAKARIFSGIQPTGIIHIGNYLGAIKQWVEMQDKVEESIFCVVDLHAITVRQDPEELRKNTLSAAAWYLACGIDPVKSAVFVQSSRPEHAELAWILNCYTYMGELFRMTQFKEKTKQAEAKLHLDNLSQTPEDDQENNGLQNQAEALYAKLNANGIEGLSEDAIEMLKQALLSLKQTTRETDIRTGVGLFDYPVLMAADILLYQATQVPVGEDQIQHVELTRDLAKRFNNLYGETFVLPDYTTKVAGKRIMGLDDPTKKMSKSASSEYNYIALSDPTDKIVQKIRKAVTDSGTVIKHDKDQPAISNLLNIYSEISGKEVAEIEDEFTGQGYGQFKDALAEVMINFLRPIRERHDQLMDNEDELIKILQAGSAKVAPLAQATLTDVKSKIGLQNL